jgi:ankyrin repeat protein
LRVDVNATSKKGHTALHVAASLGLVDVVQFLLKEKADRGIRSSDGKTAIDLAKSKNHKEVVELLS